MHELQFINSCIFFGSSSIKIDTSNPLVCSYFSFVPMILVSLLIVFSYLVLVLLSLFILLQAVHLKGERYLLTGQIHVDTSSLSGVDELPENILVDILNSEGTLLDGTSARLVPAENDKASAAVFEYSVWANPGEELTFFPQDSRYVYGCYVGG